MDRVVIQDATLYLGDCRKIFLTLPDGFAVVTDPPYPDYHTDIYRQADITFLDGLTCKQFVFWSCKADFPLTYTARHVWAKTGAGEIASYEFIYEINGGSAYRVFRGNAISNPTMARFAREQYSGHKSQKPLNVVTKLVTETAGAVVDPFMGSGTTGVACANLGRKFIGIEIERKYFDIACERIEAAYAQGRLFT